MEIKGSSMFSWPWMYLPSGNPSYILSWHFPQNHKCQCPCDSRGEVQGSPVVIQNFLAIFSIVLEILHSGTKWWTDWPTDRQPNIAFHRSSSRILLYDLTYIYEIRNLNCKSLVDASGGFAWKNCCLSFSVLHWRSACSVTLPLGDAWWLGDKEGLLITKTTDAPRLLLCPFFA